MSEKPLYLTLSPNEYIGLLDVINTERRLELALLLARSGLQMPADMACVVVGSDGKQERHAQSDTEMVFVSESFDETFRDEAHSKLHGFRRFYSLDFAYDGKPGYYQLTQSTPMSYVHHLPEQVYPDFLLNSLPIAGSDDVYYAMRTRILEEMSDETETGKRIRSHMRTQLKEYRKLMKTGITSKRVPFFDENRTVVFYNDSQHIFGFKGAFLRGIQRTTDILTSRIVPMYGSARLAHELGSRTIDRVKYMANADIISPELSNKTVEAYNWFLQQHHRMQEMYKTIGDDENTITYAYNPEKFEEYRNIALEYCYRTT